jgi:Ca2+/Na+ antiporter
MGQVDPEWTIAAGLAGGTLALGSHLTKASTRAAVNLSPEPFSTWTVSVLEDIAAVGAVLTALFFPIAFLIGLAIVVALMIWLLPKLLRLAGRILARVAATFKSRQPGARR